jgi:hypothetical protein
MEKKRLQFDFTESAVKSLDIIVERTGAATRAEVIRRALAVFDIITHDLSSGSRLILRDKAGNERELLIL